MQWEQLVAEARLNRASQADCGTHSGRWRFLPKFNQPDSIPPIEMIGWVIGTIGLIESHQSCQLYILPTVSNGRASQAFLGVCGSSTFTPETQKLTNTHIWSYPQCEEPRSWNLGTLGFPCCSTRTARKSTILPCFVTSRRFLSAVSALSPHLDLISRKLDSPSPLCHYVKS
jgi:hypothetical protein